VYYPPNYNANGPQAFPQSNMVILVDTDAGITGVGQGGSPDLIRNLARSVIGKNAFDSEMIWQAAYMDGFYSPGKERLHGLGGIDLALWDIKGKALDAPLYQLFGGKAREHIELYATSGLPPGVQAAGRRRPNGPNGFAGITHRFDLDKPLIAAVNGWAMGGGFETALACDIIVAAENALFALPEPRVGLIAGGGGVHRLPRMIPRKKAMGMILTGRRVGAREGFELGFVTEVVPQGQALEAAKRWAAQILECSPKAVRASKQAAYRGLDEPSLERAMRTVFPAQQENLDSQDYVEGPKAFAEKRRPDWQNR